MSEAFKHHYTKLGVFGAYSIPQSRGKEVVGREGRGVKKPVSAGGPEGTGGRRINSRVRPLSIVGAPDAWS